MEIEDRIRLETPEGVDVALQLAGVGSRFACALVDHVFQLVGLIGLALLFESLGTPIASAGYVLSAFLLIFGYDVAFETLNAGRTPGKRAGGLRVVRTGGEPVTFMVASVRNVMRLIDFLPAVYLTGIASILVTSRNQRLGDLAADTLVVRERRGGHPAPASGRASAAPHADAQVWDVTGVSPAELALVADFLARRDQLPADVRRRLAAQLAGRLQPKIPGAAADLDDEFLLEQIVALRAGRDG